MKKASNILFLVGEIVSVIVAVVYITCGSLFAVYSSPDKTDEIIYGIEHEIIHSGFKGTVEEQAYFIQVLFLTLAIVFFIMLAIVLINLAVTIIARRNTTKTTCILNIVFGTLSGVEVNLVGGIFGLISTIRENKE